jgi:hypothetical protein
MSKNKNLFAPEPAIFCKKKNERAIVIFAVSGLMPQNLKIF